MSAFNIKTDLTGIVASLHTPFTQHDHIDVDSLARLVKHCSESGCAGVLVTAVAGEVAALTDSERESLLDVVSANAPSDLSIVAGISANDVKTTLTLARNAAKFRVPVVMWQPPPGLDETALIEALSAIADTGEHQIMLQDLDWTGRGIAAESIARAADKIPAFTAVKVETVPAGPKYTEVQKATNGEIHLSGGWAVMQMLDGLARGLDAFIPSGLLATQVKIFNNWQRGDFAEARQLFETILPIMAFSNQHIDVSGRFWKHVRKQQGIFVSDHCRLPRPLDSIQMAEARHMCERVLALEDCQ